MLWICGFARPCAHDEAVTTAAARTTFHAYVRILTFLTRRVPTKDDQKVCSGRQEETLSPTAQKTHREFRSAGASMSRWFQGQAGGPQGSCDSGEPPFGSEQGELLVFASVLIQA